MTLLPQLEKDLFDAAEERLGSSPTRSPQRSRRPRPGSLVAVAGVVVALAVAAVAVIGLGGRGRAIPPAPVSTKPLSPARQSTGVLRLTYRALDHTPATLTLTVKILRERLSALSERGSVTRSGDLITITVEHTGPVAQSPAALAAPIRLFFYDWEANVLTPNGRTVTSQLLAQDPLAVEISQGAASAAPGSPSAGAVDLYRAVKLAEKVRPAPAGGRSSHLTPLYYAFGSPGSSACRIEARRLGAAPGAAPVPGEQCYLAGPDVMRADVMAALPRGINPSAAEVLAVPPGTVVLQAVPASLAMPPDVGDPHARFFTLRDVIGLDGAQIVDPRAGTDSAGQPDIAFGFTRSDARAFQAMTARISHRGELDSGLGGKLDQHFAVALDGLLISVPSIDFTVYPDGVLTGAAEIDGSFSTASVRALVKELRLGPLPVALDPISSTFVATGG